jgi:hypothetical protein
MTPWIVRDLKIGWESAVENPRTFRRIAFFMWLTWVALFIGLFVFIWIRT